MREDGLEGGFVLGKTFGAERILVYDDMEGLLKWTGDFPLPIGSIAKSQTFVLCGNWALRIGRTGPAPNGIGWYYVYRKIPRVGSHIFELRSHFKLNPARAAAGYGLEIEVFGGGDVVRFGFRYNEIEPDTLTYLRSDGLWSGFGGALLFSQYAWHELSIVFDLRLREYLELRMDGEVFDMTGEGAYIAASASGDCSRVGLWYGLVGNVLKYVYVDQLSLLRI